MFPAAFLVYCSISVSLASVIITSKANSIDLSPLEKLHQVVIRAGNTPPTVAKSGTLIATGPEGTEWDESCKDNGERASITDAMNAAMVLASSARDGLQSLGSGLPNPSAQEPGNVPNTQNGNYIAANDPAYTQMYGELSNQIGKVQQFYEQAVKNMNNQKGPDRRNTMVRLVCDKTFMNLAGTKNQCGDTIRESTNPDGTLGLVFPGPMRGILAPLRGRCTSLKSLVLVEFGLEIDGNEAYDWPVELHKSVYVEYASFLDSVKAQLEEFRFEQGVETSLREDGRNCDIWNFEGLEGGMTNRR